MKMLKMFLWLFPIFLFGSNGIAAEPKKVVFAYSSIGSMATGVWMAKESGAFERNGLQSEVIFISSGPVVVQALIGGDLQGGSGATNAVINAILNGAPIVGVAATANKPYHRLYVQPEINRLEDLKGKTVSVNKGSAYDSWARELEAKIGWKVESFGTQTDAVQAVLVGRADANVAGNTVIAWAVKNNPKLELSYLHTTGLVWAAPMRKDSGELRKVLENAIECMKLDNTIARMHTQWFAVAPEPGSAALTVFPGYGVPNMTGYDPTPHTPACS